MNNGTNKDIIALWIGKDSQQCAFNYYNLQAEQIFDEQSDPVLHSSIWKNINKMQPRMIVYDVQIERLAAVRQVNNKKILQKMKKQEGWSSMMGMFGQIDASPLQKHEQVDVDKWPQIKNWNDRQNNYFLIDKSFTSVKISNTKQNYNPDIEAQRFETFEQFYHINREESQNRLRRQLEKTDFLKLFFACTDQAYSGFTSKLLEYLREQCPKTNLMLTSLTETNNLPVVSLSKLYDEIDVFLPININIKYPYFKNASVHRSLAPFFSSLLTPFVMKQVDPTSYISSILSDNRKLFNSVYTLPIIDTKLNLSNLTNIFKYEQVALNSLNKQKQSANKKYYELGHKKQMQQMTQYEQFRLNYTNESYLSLDGSFEKGKYLSQSYVLKGHFNDFQKTFRPKSEPSWLSIKYLQGIFSAPQEPTNSYESFYENEYGEVVQAYPFHMVMFSHEIFGESIRRNIKITKNTKLFSEEWPESKEKLLSIADMYLELHEDSD